MLKLFRAISQCSENANLMIDLLCITIERYITCSNYFVMCLGNQQTGVAGKTTDGSQTAKGAIPVINFSENEVFILKSAKFQNHSVIIAIYLNDL